ncbi:Protein-arginine deiminase type-3, partial [Frankliniella fusca]
VRSRCRCHHRCTPHDVCELSSEGEPSLRDGAPRLSSKLATKGLSLKGLGLKGLSALSVKQQQQLLISATMLHTLNALAGKIS